MRCAGGGVQRRWGTRKTGEICVDEVAWLNARLEAFGTMAILVCDSIKVLCNGPAMLVRALPAREERGEDAEAAIGEEGNGGGSGTAGRTEEGRGQRGTGKRKREDG